MILKKGTGHNLQEEFLKAHPVVRDFAWMMGQYREKMLDCRELTVTRVFKDGHRTHGLITEFDKNEWNRGIDWRTWDLSGGYNESHLKMWEKARERWKAYGLLLRDHINEHLLDPDSLYQLAFDPHDDLKEPRDGKPAWYNQHFHSHMKKKESRDEHIHESVEESHTSGLSSGD